ncbi:MAG: phosphoglycerate dehydrogenase [Sediminibacterium sp.]|nr:phosphoglycerate dehydrogenase [Sediminibacterium sp.]
MKILISPSSFGEISEAPFRYLEEAGFSYLNNPYGRKLTEEEVITLAADCVGIIAGVEPLTAKVMDALPELKCISRVGVGMDNVDMEYARKKKIIVVNTPDGPTRAVAELTLAMTMALLRKIPQADANLKKKIWKKEIGNLLFGKKIGVIGLGRIGRMVSEQFRALGNTVIGYDLFPDTGWADTNGVLLLDMDGLLSEADIITLHVPGNPDKTPVIALDEIKKCKDGIFIINISRGGVVDEDAVYQGLVSNKLKGAAIDVFDNEPYTGPLCDLSNVILTPHLGSYASEGKLQMEIEAVINLIQVLKK